ncbi:MAG TPA: UDP-N-acetylglucosamine 1-carboxyvinyltransferase, partial [Bacteroidales bacterium]|nr:UDP-N-acetylglucosamine 1-carboxyvinyltransferase [Bacteroidales bacterium]
MSSFEITGGNRLSGAITPQGAKNEALQVICAVLLTKEKVTISNVPDIRDVNKLIDVMRFLGVEVNNPVPGTWEFTAADVHIDYLQTDEFR